MLLLQVQPFYKQPAPPFQYAYVQFSLSPEYLSQAVQFLTPQNYLSTLRPLLDALQNLDDAHKASFFGSLLLLNSSLGQGRTELQRSFLYELACAVAPEWAAREAKKDFDSIKTEADKAGFRKRNGFYNARTRRYEIQDDDYNNCRHYAQRKYWEALGPFLSAGARERLGPDTFTIRKKTFHGRPKNFDYQASGPVKCFTLYHWQNEMSAQEREFYLTGNGVAFLSFSAPRSSKKLKPMLQPGDFVSTNHNIYHAPGQPGNPHVGIYDGEGNVVNIHSPLSSDSLKRYIRKATKDITVRRLITRSSSLLSAMPLMEEPNPWAQSIVKTEKSR